MCQCINSFKITLVNTELTSCNNEFRMQKHCSSSSSNDKVLAPVLILNLRSELHLSYYVIQFLKTYALFINYTTLICTQIITIPFKTMNVQENNFTDSFCDVMGGGEILFTFWHLVLNSIFFTKKSPRPKK